MPAATQRHDEDDDSSSDDGFQVNAVTTADGVRVPKHSSPKPRRAAIRPLTAYDDASSSSSSSSSSSPAPVAPQPSPAPLAAAKKRVRFADAVSPRKRARTRAEDARELQREREDEEALLMSELARFEARVDAIDRDQETVTQELRDATDFYEQVAQRRLERRVAMLRNRLRDDSVVHSVREGEMEDMHAEDRRLDGDDLSDEHIEIKRVLRAPTKHVQRKRE